MNFFITLFITKLKLHITPSFLVSILFFPIIIFSLNLVLNSSTDDKINIGIIYEETPYSLRLIDTIEQYLKDDAVIIKYSDENLLLEDCLKRKIECGYVIPMEMNSKIKLYKTSQTMSDNVISIMISSALLQNYSGELGFNIVQKHFPNISEEDIKTNIQSKTWDYLKDGSFMDINFEIYQGENIMEDNKISHFSNTYYGVTALFCLLLGLMLTTNFIDEKNEGTFLALKSKGINLKLYYLTDTLIIFLICFCFFISSLFSFIIFYTNLSAKDILMAFSFCLAVASFSSLLSCFLKDNTIMPSIITFIFLMTAIFGEVIFKITDFFELLNILKYFFITNYFMASLTGGFLSNFIILSAFSIFNLIIIERILREDKKCHL